MKIKQKVLLSIFLIGFFTTIKADLALQDVVIQSSDNITFFNNGEKIGNSLTSLELKNGIFQQINNKNNNVLWHQGFKINKVVFQSDGNLVAYTDNEQAVWSSKSSGHPDSRLVIQGTDGNVVIYNSQNIVLWATNAFPLLSYWMERVQNLVPAITFNQITMPGSHDSGMSKANKCSGLARFSPSSTITQKHSILGQLNSGTRYFDIRLKKNGNKIYTAHFNNNEMIGGCYGQSLDEIIQEINHFLSTNSREILFLRITIYDQENNKNAYIEKLRKSLESRLYKKSSYFNNMITIPHTELKSLAGKVIILTTDNALVNHEKGIYHWSNYFPSYGNSWANVNNVRELQNIQKIEIDQSYGLGYSELFFVGWYLTPKDISTPKDFASKTNPLIPGIVNYMASKDKLANVFYYDFVNSDYNNIIIMKNSNY